MLVSSSRCHPKINITGIEQKDYIKYLGVYIDKHLNWQPQIQHVNNKLAKNLGILSKLRYYIDLNILKQICYALMCQHLRTIFFAHPKERAAPYFKLLTILKLDKIYVIILKIIKVMIWCQPEI